MIRLRKLAAQGEVPVRTFPDGRVVVGESLVLGTIRGGGRSCFAVPTLHRSTVGGQYAYRIDAIRGLALERGFEVRKDGPHLVAIDLNFRAQLEQIAKSGRQPFQVIAEQHGLASIADATGLLVTHSLVAEMAFWAAAFLNNFTATSSPSKPGD